jgi:hypothetical protein
MTFSEWLDREMTFYELLDTTRVAGYLDDDIDVSGEEADQDCELELGEDELAPNPDPRSHLHGATSPPTGQQDTSRDCLIGMR